MNLILPIFTFLILLGNSKETYQQQSQASRCANNSYPIVCGINQRSNLTPEKFFYRYGGWGSQGDQNEIVKIMNGCGLWPNNPTNGYHTPFLYYTDGGQNAVVLQDALAPNRKQGAIYVDNHWLNEIVRQTGTSWSKTAILAHEMGHIYYGHIYKPYDRNSTWKNEYEADLFTGYSLCKLGASLCESEAIFYQIGQNIQDSPGSHPSLSNRLKAVREGYRRAGCSSNFYNCDYGDIYLKNYSSHDVTIEVENRRYVIKRAGDMRIQLSGNTAVVYLWECPANSSCRWSSFSVEISRDYTIKNSGYVNGLTMKRNY